MMTGPPVEPGIAQSALLSAQQPPVTLLAAFAQLELDLPGSESLDCLVVERRLRTAQAGDQLGALSQELEHLAQILSRPTPGHDLLLDEAERVALAEASLDVVARRRRDRARAYVLERLRHRGGVGGSVA